MIPLASALLPFPGQMRREDHLKSASLPDRLSSSGRITILCSSSREVSRGDGRPVDKIAYGCTRVTPRARQRWALVTKRLRHDEAWRIAADETGWTSTQIAIDRRH